MPNPIKAYNTINLRIKSAEDATAAWKLQAHDYEDALMEIIYMCGEPTATEYEPKDAVKVVRKMMDEWEAKAPRTEIK